MSVVYVKEPHNLSKRTDVIVPDIDKITVQGFKSEVAKAINKSPEKLMLMYAGRILKHGKSLSQYSVVNGVTVFVMSKKEPMKVSVTTPSLGESSTSHLRRLVHNPRVHRILQRMMANPALLRSLLRDSPLEGDPSIQGLVQDPAIQANLSNPEELIRVIEDNLEEAGMVEDVLRTIGATLASNSGRAEEDVSEEELIDLMEQSLEEDMETMESNDGLPDAQDQNLEHSQTNQQSMEVSPPPLPQDVRPPQTQNVPTVSGSAGAIPVTATTGSAITPQQLSSALSSVMQSPNNTFLSPPQPSSAGPSSLPSQQSPSSNVDGAGPASLPVYVRNNSDPGTPRVSQDDLNRALQSVLQNTQPAPSDTHHHHHHRHRAGRHHRYHAQLQQLYGMGLRDDAACVHALDATNGDINAALELLLGSGQ